MSKNNSHGFSCSYYHYEYDKNRSDIIYAVTETQSSRMTLEEIQGGLNHFGFNRIHIVEDQKDHPGGPAFSLIAEKCS